LQQQQQQQQQQPIKKRRISEEPGTGDTPEHKEEFQPFLSQMEKEKKELDVRSHGHNSMIFIHIDRS
jgi:hypothetical protein